MYFSAMKNKYIITSICMYMQTYNRFVNTKEVVFYKTENQECLFFFCSQSGIEKGY